MRKIKFLIVTWILTLNLGARANDLQTCAEISDAAERLFCYDQLSSGANTPRTNPTPVVKESATAVSENTPQQIASPSSNGSRSPVPATTTSETKSTSQQIAPPSSIGSTSPVPATTTSEPKSTSQPIATGDASPVPSATTSELKGSEETFGMELELARRGPDKIESNYVGYFGGSSKTGTKFALQNGQVWQQTSSGRLTKKGEGVLMIIKRASLGSYRLKVAGSNRAVRVKRIK